MFGDTRHTVVFVDVTELFSMCGDNRRRVLCADYIYGIYIYIYIYMCVCVIYIYIYIYIYYIYGL